MSPSSARATVLAYFESVNVRDLMALTTLFAEDVEHRCVGQPTRRGRAAVIAAYPELLGIFEQGHDEVLRLHTAGNVVTAEIRFEGWTLDGVAVTFDAVELFELDGDGRIARLSLWYDTRDVARQVRAAPTR